jgi:hypothetical protein
MDSICQAVHRGLPAPAKAGDHGVHLPPFQQDERAGDGPRIKSGAAQDFHDPADTCEGRYP